MILYLIRHAIAEELGQKNEFSDEKRALTAEGRSRMREAAKGLRKLGLQIDVILTSPLVRALSTAEIVGDVLGLDKGAIKTTSNLAPGASFDSLFAEIRSQNMAESIALVGHQPDLGDLMSTVVAGNRSVCVELKKGGTCCINVAETIPSLRGNLIWMLTPKQLRMLASA
jgi:phosphohistidine phosphatase